MKLPSLPPYVSIGFAEDGRCQFLLLLTLELLLLPSIPLRGALGPNQIAVCVNGIVLIPLSASVSTMYLR